MRLRSTHHYMCIRFRSTFRSTSIAAEATATYGVGGVGGVGVYGRG